MFTRFLRMIMKFEDSMDGHCVGNDSPSRSGHCY